MEVESLFHVVRAYPFSVRNVFAQENFRPTKTVPNLPSLFTKLLWGQFQALIPARADQHSLGCHKPRIPDRLVFDKLVLVLVFGVAYEKIADTTCWASTVRGRRYEWIHAVIFEQLEQTALDSNDQFVAIDSEDIVVGGIVNALRRR